MQRAILEHANTIQVKFIIYIGVFIIFTGYLLFSQEYHWFPNKRMEHSASSVRPNGIRSCTTTTQYVMSKHNWRWTAYNDMHALVL